MNRITHVGVLVRDIDSAILQWSQLFDMHLVKRLEVPQEGVRSAFLSRDGSADYFLVELVEPTHPDDADNIVSRRLRDHGEGLLHLAMIDGDIAAARTRLLDGGARFAAREAVSDSGDERLIVSPKAANGVLVEVLSTREWDGVWSAD
jgi:catechol 2,3-dioxygenase-like lactoylglutathione lyase family enzyme